MWQKPQNGNYIDLKKRIRQQMEQKEKVNEKILELIQSAFEKTLADEQVVLARPEKKRMQEQILRELLNGLLNENNTGELK